MLASNSDRENNIIRARERLADFFEIIAQSNVLDTEPVGKKYKNRFLNQALKILADDTAKIATLHFKHIENEMGRSAATNKQGIVPIDIDLIFWNGEQRRNDYDRFEFVRQCVDEIS
jgi:2-amino-4-hydroxy-6-hydroxymethyldihydropteridine diphosphokinase